MSFLFLKLNLSTFLLSIIFNLENIISLFKFLKLALSDQYSSGLKDSISCSLWVISFRATDCTLPADLEPGSFVHNIGEILKPTK